MNNSTIGKERIYVSVAQHLKQKVYVDRRRYRILSSLEWPKEQMQIFTTDKTETNLWVVPLGSVNFKQMPDYLDEGNSNKNKAFTAPYTRVVGFRPTGEHSISVFLHKTCICSLIASFTFTGWTYQAQDKQQRTLGLGKSKPSSNNLISSKTSGRFSVHGVPYSEHSSFPVSIVKCATFVLMI